MSAERMTDGDEQKVNALFRLGQRSRYISALLQERRNSQAILQLNMERKVRKITIVSKPEATYFLQIEWKQDLGNGFNVTLCDGQNAWTSEVSKEDLSKEAADMEMEHSKYIEELKKALITVQQTGSKYSFDLVKDEENPEMYCFTYEKTLKDVSFKLGSLRLTNASDPAEIIKEFINYCLNCATELHSRNEYLLKENERLRQDWDDMHKQLEKFVKSKEDLERDLYTRFTLVLNEKKAKIRSLNQKLSQTEKKVSEKSSSSIPFDTLPVADYNGSTDEESSEVKEEAAPPPISKRRSLLNSPDDSPDIAPSRKRRLRGQKDYYTQMKDKLSQLEDQEDQRSKPASSKTTGKNPSSVNPPLPTSKNSPDPDDLFSDI
ncbi:DNA repair protein XRCC4 isoform X3 [Hyla sarda]|uniref:DNA repair protein XRCC4 isoform X3 n=1 Tax=Hyla sarda TaxID=327740 RepID=UPI0024C2DCE0|nr:DNA repair protein XRCC4 isoform X3 [Hyla sarda]